MSPRSKEQFHQMKEAARTKILDAALTVFSHNGLAAASISEIAKEAGISTGLLYHYFSSKEMLFQELVGSAVSVAEAALQECMETNATARERLQFISKSLLDILCRGNKTARFFTLMLQAGLAGNLSDTMKNQAKASALPFRYLLAIVREGQQEGTFKSGEPAQLVMLYWAALQGLCAFKLIMKETFEAPAPYLLDRILLIDEGECHYPKESRDSNEHRDG
ncbi:MAG: yfiR [Paenibacillaceae bacterium]|jgi:AcrR family transcriptional regulator|nr:yfiR [Paenibacillaceae bacterium]